MSDGSVTHPDPEQLRDFRLGLLTATDADTIQAHLVTCAECLSRSDQLTPATQAVTPEGATMAERNRQTHPVAASPTGEMPRIPPELAAHARYRILKLLGAGGMGQVYQAEHRVMERLVALKVIKRSLTDEAPAVERFHREVKAAARLTHPNIVAAHDAERAGDLHFLVMEYVEGVDLSACVAKSGPLPPTLACDYIRQTALGLAHAHDRGMVHRDVKPANLMLTPDGHIKILDFGLARFGRDAAAGLTGTGAVMGTPDYIAPEQAMDSRAVDHRADIYSLGCTLYFLLTGRPPCEGGSAMEKLFAHIEGRHPALAAVRPDLPLGLAVVVERMMARTAEARYATAVETAEALAPFCAVADAVAIAAEPTVLEVPWVLAASDLPPPPTAVSSPFRPEVLPVGVPLDADEVRQPLHPATSMALTLGMLVLPFSWATCVSCLTLPVALIGAGVGVFGLVHSWDGPRRPRSYAVLGVGLNVTAVVLAFLGHAFFANHAEPSPRVGPPVSPKPGSSATSPPSPTAGPRESETGPKPTAATKTGPTKSKTTAKSSNRAEGH